MHCPFCGALDTKVVDSRLVAEGQQVRRRRECVSCHERFTTFEEAELLMPRLASSSSLAAVSSSLHSTTTSPVDSSMISVEEILPTTSSSGTEMNSIFFSSILRIAALVNLRLALTSTSPSASTTSTVVRCPSSSLVLTFLR